MTSGIHCCGDDFSSTVWPLQTIARYYYGVTPTYNRKKSSSFAGIEQPLLYNGCSYAGARKIMHSR
jgi:hypothetical protein